MAHRRSRIKVSLVIYRIAGAISAHHSEGGDRRWAAHGSPKLAPFTTQMILGPNTGNDSQVKTTFNFEASQGKSTTYESVGESKNTLVISGNSFTE